MSRPRGILFAGWAAGLLAAVVVASGQEGRRSVPPVLATRLLAPWPEVHLRRTEADAAKLRDVRVLADLPAGRPALVLLWRHDDGGKADRLLRRLYRDAEVVALASLCRRGRLDVAGEAALGKVYDVALPRLLVYDAAGSRRADISMVQGRARCDVLLQVLRRVVAAGRPKAFRRFVAAHRRLLEEMTPVARALRRLEAEEARQRRAGAAREERERLARARRILEERWAALRAREARLVRAFYQADA